MPFAVVAPVIIFFKVPPGDIEKQPLMPVMGSESPFVPTSIRPSGSIQPSLYLNLVSVSG